MSIKTKNALHSLLILSVYGFIACHQANAVTETIVIKGGIKHEGTFQEFTADRFYFQIENADKLNERRIDVESMSLNPPAKVTVKPRGATAIEGFRLKKYQDSQFFFDNNGKETVMHVTKISSVTPVLDLNREMQRTQKDTPLPAEDSASAQPADMTSYIKTGMVTVIHFHMDSVLSSVRQGSYLESLSKEMNNNNTVHLVRIKIPDWNSPSLKKYNITSIPQFWFYNRNGDLVDKLTDRFTDEEIKATLQKAKKQR